MAAHRGVARTRVHDVKLREKEGAKPGDGGAERVRSRWESGIIAVTTGIVAAALWAADTQNRPQARPPGCVVQRGRHQLTPLAALAAACVLLTQAAVLVSLTALAVLAEESGLAYHALRHVSQRPGAPPGLPLGTLALPWCYAALLATAPDAASLQAASRRLALTAASSAATLAPLLYPCTGLARALLAALAGALLTWCSRLDSTCGVWTVAAAAAAPHAHAALLAALPHTLTAGEAVLACHAVMLVIQAILPSALASTPALDAIDTLCVALVAVPLLASLASSRAARHHQQGVVAGLWAAVAVLGAACLTATLPGGSPVAWALAFLQAAPLLRLALLSHWAACVALPLRGLMTAAQRRRVPRILLRKAFHVMALLGCAPAAVLDPDLLRLGLAAGCGALVVAEAARQGKQGGLGRAVARIFAPFADERDAGALVLSPFSLLLGMAAPVWMAAPVAVGQARDGASRLPLCAWAGILALGVGDAAAAGVGVAYGRTRLLPRWSKTWKGTTAGGLAMLGAAAGVMALGGAGFHGMGVVGATAVAAALEAVTAQNDNAFVPLAYFALLRLAST